MKLLKTTSQGFVNRNGQEVIGGRTGLGTDYLQYAYPLKCNHCKNVYGANGSDIHLRRCPSCQHGRPGLQIPEGIKPSSG